MSPDNHPLQIIINRACEPLLNNGGEWDQLLSRSQAQTIFLSGGWLKAAYETYSKDKQLWVPTVYISDQLMAAAAFEEKNGIVEFVGTGASDYLDFIIDQSLSEHECSYCIQLMLEEVIASIPHFKYFKLKNLLIEQNSPTRIIASNARLFSIRTRKDIAPALVLSEAPDVLKKHKFPQIYKNFNKKGNISIKSFNDSETILQKLEHLFELHIQRWANTSTPSFFNQQVNRDFYRKMVSLLGPTGHLRYMEIYLDETMVAAHLGSHENSKYTFYKPCHNPLFARQSPGKLLLSAVIKEAINEQATEFDFTIGAEPYKLHVANKIRQLVDLEVTNSRLYAYKKRTYIYIKNLIKPVLQSLGIWKWLRS